LRVFLISCLLVVSFASKAFDFGGGKIDIPFPFLGPTIAKPNPDVEVYGFTKSHFIDGKSALLQISKFSPPGGIPELGEEERIKSSKQYLLQFLSGVERQRSDFAKGSIEIIHISDLPVAKIKWRGKAHGESLNGVMYCLIHAGSIVSFHTQDFTSYNDEFIELAVNSIENLTLER